MSTHLLNGDFNQYPEKYLFTFRNQLKLYIFTNFRGMKENKNEKNTVAAVTSATKFPYCWYLQLVNSVNEGNTT